MMLSRLVRVITLLLLATKLLLGEGILSLPRYALATHPSDNFSSRQKVVPEFTHELSADELADELAFYPPPFLNNKIDLNSPDEVLRMIRIIELYPLLKRRVGELASEKQQIIDLSLMEKNTLLTDYEQQNNYLKNRGKFWYYVAVIGIPVVGVVALAGGVYVGITLAGKAQR